MGGTMGSTLEQQVAQAVRAGLDRDEIEKLVIDPARLEEDEKAALWLYAQALEERRDESILINSERPLIKA
jgi:hypothetical protein